MREWTDRQVEILLSRAIDRSTPDVYELAAHTPVSREEAPEEAAGHPEGRETARPALRAAMGLCACLVLVCCLGAFQFFHTAAVIGIDVNPSIELTANRFDKVLQVRALNADAQAILGDMKLNYMDLDTAINAIIGSMVRGGYFIPGQDVAVLVSVSGGSTADNDQLRQRVALDIESAVTASGGTAAILTQDVTAATDTPASPPPSGTPSARERAAKNDISYGKQVFIDRLLTLDPGFSERALAAMSIGEIAALVQERGIDLGQIVDYDDDDSPRENIEDFIDDVDEEAEEHAPGSGGDVDDSHDNEDDDKHDGDEDDDDDDEEEDDDDDEDDDDEDDD